NEIPGSCYRPEWSPSDHELIFLALTRQDGINFRVIVVFNPITKTKKAILSNGLFDLGFQKRGKLFFILNAEV
ncbi:MAG: hypothetical protein ACNA7V_11535, partial [Bacteroidales bacterium]